MIRALQRSPEAGDAFVKELELARGTDRTFDQVLDRVEEALSMSDPSAWDESEARRLVKQLAVCWGASLCLRHEPLIAGAYIRSRLELDWGSELGTLPRGLNLAEIARRACPEGNRG